MSAPSEDTLKINDKTTLGLEDELNERQNGLREACVKKNVEMTDDPKTWATALREVPVRMYVDDKYKILYCPIHKVATANWRRVLMVLAGDVENVTQVGKEHYNTYYAKHRQLHSYPREQQIFRLANYTKFMIVRHPLERLISAYRDKFEFGREHGEWYYLKDIASNILYWNKPESLNTQKIHNVTFRDLVKFIITHPNNVLDMHWERYHKLCRPCEIKYDIIGKYETLERDSNHILEKVHADDVIKFPPSKINNHATNSSMANLEKYLSTLTAKELEELYNIYKDDFELFGYV
ncbi:carbohydrate sulfotransferase 9-like [Glandiceps talaboti]